MERINDDNYRLSSGREFYAVAGRICICVRDPYVGGIFIGHGSDGELSGAGATQHEDEADPKWTNEERRELADFMIAQWTAFKDSNG